MRYSVSMTNPDDGHEELKHYLGQRLGLEPSQLALLWGYLVDDHVIGEFEQGYIGRDEVLDQARRLYERFRSWEGKRPVLSRGPREFEFSGRGEVWIKNAVHYVRDMPVNRGIVTGPLTNEESMMAEALEKYFAVHASARPVVREFRKEFLPGNGPLTPGDAEDLLTRTVYAPKHFDSAIGGFPRTEVEMALENVVGELAGSYPWPFPYEIQRFVLSGDPPSIEPVRSGAVGAESQANSGVIAFMPFVSEQTVLNAFKRYRAYLLNRPRQKASSEKSLRIFTFTLSQVSEEGKFPSWADLLTLWNRAYPDEKLSDRSALRRTYIRVEKALLEHPDRWRNGNRFVYSVYP